VRTHRSTDEATGRHHKPPHSTLLQAGRGIIDELRTEKKLTARIQEIKLSLKCLTVRSELIDDGKESCPFLFRNEI